MHPLNPSKAGTAVFDAASSPVRMQILRLLSTKGALTYTEVMSSIKLDPIRDAGKFVYHLRSLIEAGLLQLDKETKKYSITELGALIVKFARDIEEYVAVKRGRLFVRTSRLAIEEFDRSKITNSLVTEAGVPQDLAEDIAAEAEERLIRLKTTYLTAPLIREFINAILIEKKLEDYRHKLTRVGMPIYDVTQLFKTASESMLDVEAVKKAAGSSAIEEYVLLDSIPREIADAHLSGEIHIDHLSDWILKPSNIQHDLPYFFKLGLEPAGVPKSLESALVIASKLWQLCKNEVSGEQGYDMFNVHLAPFAKGLAPDRLEELLTLFLAQIDTNSYSNHPTAGLSLGLELSIPKILNESPAVGPEGKVCGRYGDYSEESQKLLDALLSAVRKLSHYKPLFNPRIIIKIREERAPAKEIRDTAGRVHELASEYCLPYFSYLKSDGEANYLASGARLSTDWSQDYEGGCVRTGCMDTVFLNLPRVAHESRKKDELFFTNLEKKIELAAQALKSKEKIMKERIQQRLLPVLCSGGGNRRYFYDKSSTYLVSFVGLSEAVSVHTGSSFTRGEESMRFALEAIRYASTTVREVADELEFRFSLGQVGGASACERLAQIDLERYGPGMASAEGLRTHPYYNDIPLVPYPTKISLDDRISVESKFQSMLPGGHLATIQVSSDSTSGEALVKLTDRACSRDLRFFTYTSTFTYCIPCNYTHRVMLTKCSKCGSDSLTHYARASSSYEPLTAWPEAKRRAIDRRLSYSVT